MSGSLKLSKLEKIITNDPKFLFTLLSYLSILAMFINLNTINSAAAGCVLFILYFLVNGVFLGNAFFEKEETFFRLTFGALSLIMLLSFVGWLIFLIYNLDVIRFTVVLLITTALSSLSNRRMKHKNVTD